MFRLNHAKYEDICLHLKSCNQLFIPNLSDRVDILKYSNKIHEKADTYEKWINHKLISLIAIYLNDKNKSAFITNFSVEFEYQGKGLGQELFTFMENDLFDKGFRELGLEVNSNNHPALNFYKKIGFCVINFTEGNNNLIMKKLINRSNHE